MNELDRMTVEFMKAKIDAACAAEFRWGIAVGAIVGFVLGLVASSVWST